MNICLRCGNEVPEGLGISPAFSHGLVHEGCATKQELRELLSLNGCCHRFLDEATVQRLKGFLERAGCET